MAEDLVLVEGDKSAKYEGVIPQIKALIGDEKDWVANQANVAAALKETFGFLWVGFGGLLFRVLLHHHHSVPTSSLVGKTGNAFS